MRPQRATQSDADADIEEDHRHRRHDQRRLTGEGQEVLALGGDKIEHPEALDEIKQEDDDARQRHRLEDEELGQVCAEP